MSTNKDSSALLSLVAGALLMAGGYFWYNNPTDSYVFNISFEKTDDLNGDGIEDLVAVSRGDTIDTYVSNVQPNGSVSYVVR